VARENPKSSHRSHATMFCVQRQKALVFQFRCGLQAREDSISRSAVTLQQQAVRALLDRVPCASRARGQQFPRSQRVRRTSQRASLFFSDTGGQVEGRRTVQEIHRVKCGPRARHLEKSLFVAKSLGHGSLSPSRCSPRRDSSAPPVSGFSRLSSRFRSGFGKTT